MFMSFRHRFYRMSPSIKELIHLVENEQRRWEIPSFEKRKHVRRRVVLISTISRRLVCHHLDERVPCEIQFPLKIQ